MIDPGLSGRTVLVTGGAMNIGAQVSRAFAAQGARVAVHYVAGAATTSVEHARVTREGVDAFVASLPDAIAVEEDFLEPGTAARLLDRVEEHLGPIDVLINNAGQAEDADTFDSLDEGGVERTFRVNAVVPAVLIAELSRRVPAGAAAGSTCVINISTDAARAFPGQVAYGASKAALESLTRGAALDLGPGFA